MLLEHPYPLDYIDKLISRLFGQYRIAKAQREEFRQECHLAGVRAWRRWDSTRGVKLTTYLHTRVTGALKDRLKYHARPNRVADAGCEVLPALYR